MSDVEQARERYRLFGEGVIYHRDVCNLCRRAHLCRTGARWGRSADAASISLDLAVAEEVARRSVAYA